MIFSRTMREGDYEQLRDEGALIREIHEAIHMWYPAQHHHRLWEYSLALKVLKYNFGEVLATEGHLTVSDHGCGAGYLSPMMYWLGHRVKMYECWSFGNEEKYMMDQLNGVKEARGEKAGTYEMLNRPLGGLVEEDKGVDAAFCISTLEHIRDYQKAFWDLISTVKKGGIVFMTTDFAEDEVDHYAHSGLRAGRMFTRDTYEGLRKLAEYEGFELILGADWNWHPACRLVNDYGFASLAMRRSE